MAPVVGYATLQVIPSLKGVHSTIRQELNGQDVGQQVGADLSEGIESGFDTGGLLDKLGGPMGAAGLAMGATIGAAALKGIQDAMGSQSAQAMTQAQLGLSEADAAYYGQVAGDVYAANFGESLDHVNEAVAAVGSSLSDSLGTESLQTATEQALTFAQVFGTEVAEATTVAGTAIRVGLADDATEAFDLMTAAAQKMPASIRGELLPIVEEYGVFLAELGFTGEEAFGLLARASEGGAIQLDKAGDALKEFQIRSTDMSATSVAAYETIGLNAETMSAKILAGGETAKAAFDAIVAGLLDIEDPVERSTAAISLFGTPLEDLSVAKIPDFLEGLQTTGDALGDFEGATDRAAETIGGTLESRLETLKRSLTTGLADVMETQVLPVMEDAAGILESVGGIAGQNVQPLLLLGGAWAGLKIATAAGALFAAGGALETVGIRAAYAAQGIGQVATGIATLPASSNLSRLQQGMGNLQTSVAGLASGLNPVTVGFMALGAAYLYMSNKSSQAEAEMGRLASQIDAVARAGQTGADDLDRAFREQLADSLAGLDTGFEGVGDTLNEALEQTGMTAHELLNIIQSSDVVTGEMVTLAGELEGAVGGAADEFWTLRGAWASTETQAAILTDRQGELAVSADDAGSAAADLAGTSEGLAGAQEGVAGATAEVVDEFEGWKTVIDEIMGVNVDFEQALINQSEAMLALAQADDEARAAGEEWSTSLDLRTEQGQRNREMLSQLIDGAIGVAEAYYEQTGSIDGANLVLAQQRERFIDAAVAAGWTRDEVEEYLGVTKQWPSDLTTILQAEPDWASLAAADTALDDVAKQRIATFVADVLLENVGLGGPGVVVNGTTILQRWGGITEYAGGGIHAHVGRGDLIRYAEPATGGEAFIPRLGDRARSMGVLSVAAGWLDAGIIDKKRVARSAPSRHASSTVEAHFHSQATDWDGVWADARVDLARLGVI